MKIKFGPDPMTAYAGCLRILDSNNEHIGQIHSPKCFTNKRSKWKVTTDKTLTTYKTIAVCDTFEEAKVAAIAYWF